MTTQQIQYIIAITEEGSFSAAAKKLVVTQPSISQLVKNIEYTIGAPLFDRTTQPIKLTPVGIAYYEAAKKIENVNRELQNRVSEINDLQFGTLTIGTSPFRAACMLPKSIAYFKEKYPGIYHANRNKAVKALRMSRYRLYGAAVWALKHQKRQF